MHECRANDTVAKDFTNDEGDRSVQPDQNTGANEGWSPFDDPEPVLAGDRSVVVVTPDEKPGEDVPIP